MSETFFSEENIYVWGVFAPVWKHLLPPMWAQPILNPARHLPQKVQYQPFKPITHNFSFPRKLECSSSSSLCAVWQLVKKSWVWKCVPLIKAACWSHRRLGGLPGCDSADCTTVCHYSKCVVWYQVPWGHISRQGKVKTSQLSLGWSHLIANENMSDFSSL